MISVRGAWLAAVADVKGGDKVQRPTTRSMGPRSGLIHQHERKTSGHANHFMRLGRKHPIFWAFTSGRQVTSLGDRLLQDPLIHSRPIQFEIHSRRTIGICAWRNGSSLGNCSTTLHVQHVPSKG